MGKMSTTSPRTAICLFYFRLNLYGKLTDTVMVFYIFYGIILTQKDTVSTIDSRCTRAYKAKNKREKGGVGNFYEYRFGHYE